MGCDCNAKTYIYAGSTPYYTAPVASGGPSGLFAVNVTHMVGSPNIEVRIEQRPADGSSSSWTTAGTFSAITSTGVYTKEVNDLEEYTRFVFDFTGGVDGQSFNVSVAKTSFFPT